MEVMTMKRIVSLILAVMLALTMIPAMAAAQASIVKETLYSGTGEYYIKINNWTYEEEIVSVTSTNSSVLKVTGRQSRYVLVKNVGSAKIKIIYKLNGNSHTISCTFTVKDYPKPIKSLTVNGRKITLTKEARVRYRFDWETLDNSSSNRINMKPAAGWTIYDIKAYYYKLGNTSRHYNLTVRNNRSFTLRRRCEAVVTYILKNRRGTKFSYVIEIKGGGE
jgi:hypothetical protein